MNLKRRIHINKKTKQLMITIPRKILEDREKDPKFLKLKKLRFEY